MTASKTETAIAGFHELEPSELEMARGMLNPQPIPPGVASHLSSFSWVALNPQPLPPRELPLRQGVIDWG
ncbi:hypothetical protein [Vitiosangium sp. GDMCC 1.1324]|uniref:hypothetical protein n=1 Tax=Vitiosangium sp. (strain GDMCC 1.1324) TaxID=2138576 RepID=UPI000D345D59|nr:hypothetical protein [Vitiosangium sp. GDMCC 1.1324]PTL81066.1 hypothetical protein DAT35_23315 [Vitiosangium sp. GDMCC 1.1324]